MTIVPVKPAFATKIPSAVSAHGITSAWTFAPIPVEDVEEKQVGEATDLPMDVRRQTAPAAVDAPANPASALPIPTVATMHGMTSVSTNAPMIVAVAAVRAKQEEASIRMAALPRGFLVAGDANAKTASAPLTAIVAIRPGIKPA